MAHGQGPLGGALSRDEYDGEGNHSVFGYDDEGNRTLVQAPKGQRTTLAYDERGALLTVTQPPTAAGTPITRHGYDENRNRTNQTDARGHAVAMEYDDLDRLEWMIQPGNLRTEHKYDENGNLERVTDPNGNLTVNTYDELNRLRVKTYTPAAGPEVPWRRGVRIEYVLDENGNPTATYDDYVSGTDPPVRLTTSRVFDRLDRLTSEASQTAYGQTVTVGTTYFANGLRRTVTDAASAVTRYEYDGQNRLKTARSNAGTPDERATGYTYWPDGLVREVQSPNGVKATHLYDRADRLRNLTNTRGPTVISSYAYGYDRNGNREFQVEVNGGLTETTTYGYDPLDRLERITYPIDSSHPTGRTVTYGYDLVGNRRGEKEVDGASVVRSDKTATFDPLNRLTAVDDVVDNANDATFTYDNNGNQRTKITGGVTRTYVYDDRNQLAEVRTSAAGPTPVARFQYDAAGRRILKIGSPTDPSDSGTRQFVYDQTAVLQELDSAGLAQARYEWGGDRLLSLNRMVGPALQRRFYSFDALGSVTNLTDDAGAARASYHLDTWGNYRFPAELSPAGDLSGAGRNRFGFTGHFFDTETQLYHAKARYFDPQFGRFTSQDSYLGELTDPPSLHRYFYANANPTSFVDPTGHSGELVDAARAEQARLAALAAAGQSGPAFTNDQGGNVVQQDRGAVPNRPTPVNTADELSGDQRRMFSRETERLREEREWRDGQPKVVIEDNGGFLDKASRLPDQAKQWAGDKAESLAKRRFAPSDAKAREIENRRAAFADRDPSLVGAAERQNSQGERGQEAAGDLARAGAEGGAELATYYLQGKAVQVVSTMVGTAFVAVIANGGGNSLKPTMRYGFGGRVESGFAKIGSHHLGGGTGTTAASRGVARSLGGGSDDAGHLIAKLLGGPGGKGYVVPQNLSVNRGAFRSFEAGIAQDVRAGREVFVRVVPKYSGASTRPYEIVYQVRVDGKTTSVVFPNPP